VLESIHEKALELLKEKHEVSFDEKDLMEAEVVVIRTYTKINKEFLDKFPKLRFVVRCGVGLENVDEKECKKRGVEVFNSPGSNSNAVAELVMGLMLSHYRGIHDANRSVKKGEWNRNDFLGRELNGKTLGLVGFGNIPRIVARLAKAFGMEVLAHDPFLNDEVFEEHGVFSKDLNKLVSESDVVSVHVPLLPETKNLFGAERLGLMKKGSLLINTSRGSIINETALLNVLKDNLGGACLDVFENEPLPAGSALLTAPNLLLTPHIGAMTDKSFKDMCVEAVKKVL